MKAKRLPILIGGVLLAILGDWCEAAAPKEAPVRLQQQAILKGQKELLPNSLAFSPDGKILASIESAAVRSFDNTIHLWDVDRGKCIATLRQAARQVAFHPDGKTFASCGGRKIKLWSVADHKEIATLRCDFPVHGIAFSRDGKTLGALEKSRKDWLTVWNVERREELRWREITFGPGREAVYPSMKKPVFLVVGRDGRSFTLVDVLTGEADLSCKGHDRPIVGFALDREAKMIASADDLAVRLWNRATGENVATIEHLADAIFSPALRPNGRNTACALSPNGKLLACAYEYQIPNGPRGGGFRLYALPGGKKLADMPQESRINSLVFRPDGRLLAVGAGMDIDLWSIPDAWLKKDK